MYDLRRVITLPAAPRRWLVNVSADNRFQLFVNGQRIGDGPARGDLQHWRYETFDLGPYLHAGQNVIAARVWNFGEQAPSAQILLRTAFLLWSSGPAPVPVDTGAQWQVRAEPAWSYETKTKDSTITGPSELLDGSHYDWAWNQLNDQATWSAPVLLAPASFATVPGPTLTAATWQLVPDVLPPMEYTADTAGKLVRSTGVETTSFPSSPLIIPAHHKATLLLDHGVETTGYPQLAVTHGAGANIRMTYAEALLDDHDQKGNRNEIDGKHVNVHVQHDTFLPGGGDAVHTFEPLWWRTWRYLQVEVETGDEPLTLQSFKARYSAYPLREAATFTSSDPELRRMWDVGWRTIRVDAHETYMDCPFYEQTQYIGDSRIEALVTYVVSGDDRLARQALLAFADSWNAAEVTQSSFPVRGVQIIPPFSLLWIGMLHDFWMYRPHTEETVREMLPYVRRILAHFGSLQRKDALLGKLPQNSFGHWNFLDWTSPYPIGAPPEDADGGSVPISLQMAAALRDAADLEDTFGEAARAASDRDTALHIAHSVEHEAWDQRSGLLADTPARTSFSQHANILGVLTDAIPPEKQQAVLRTILAGEMQPSATVSTPALAPASYYFRFYLSRALDHAGMDDLYLQTLGPWRHMLSLGLTTWAEQPEPTRSDAHAWSSHPNYDLLHTWWQAFAPMHRASPRCSSSRISAISPT